jgi:phospholipase C
MPLGTMPCHISVKANAYYDGEAWEFDLLAGVEVDETWHIARQGYWYDFTASAQKAGFSRRFAGRMETGVDSVSDPAIAVSVGTTDITETGYPL